MACDISKGRTSLPCKDSISGLKAIYVTNYGEYVFTTSSTSAGHLITGLPAGITSSNTFKFELKNSGNTFNQDIISSRDNNTTIFTQTLNFVLPKLSSELEYQIKMLAWSRPQIFVEANNGTMILLGERFGCEITGKSEIQGTMDAINGYSMIAVAVEQNPVWFLTASASAALKALASTQSVGDNTNTLIPVDFTDTTPITIVDGIFVIQPDDRAIIYNANGFSGTSSQLIRINPNGTIDESVEIVERSITSIVLMDDGTFMTGLIFGEGILKWNSDFSIDTSYVSDLGGEEVYLIDKQSDGKLYAYFSNTIVKMNTNGTFDTTYGQSNCVSNVTNGFNSIIKQSDDKLLFSISATASIGANGGTFSKGPGVYRLNTNGSFDNTFNFATSSLIPASEMILQSDNKLIVIMSNTIGYDTGYIKRYNTDGSLDTTYNTLDITISNVFITLNIQDDGKLVVMTNGDTGDAIYVASVDEYYSIIRLNTDGSFDNTFTQTQLFSIGGLKSIANYSNNDMLVLGDDMSWVGFTGMPTTITRIDRDGNEVLFINS